MRPATRRFQWNCLKSLASLREVFPENGIKRWTLEVAYKYILVRLSLRAERQGRCGDCAYNFTPFNKEGG